VFEKRLGLEQWMGGQCAVLDMLVRDLSLQALHELMAVTVLVQVEEVVVLDHLQMYGESLVVILSLAEEGWPAVRWRHGSENRAAAEADN
jgi:hypothetical protein